MIAAKSPEFKPRSEHKNKYDYSGKPSKVMAAEAAAIQRRGHA